MLATGQGNMKKCPSCGKKLPNKAQACIYCGKSEKRDHEALLAFYKFKAELEPDFFYGNKQNLNILETELIKEYANQL
jgi:predicted amidophosphoribosyltransferase